MMVARNHRAVISVRGMFEHFIYRGCCKTNINVSCLPLLLVCFAILTIDATMVSIFYPLIPYFDEKTFDESHLMCHQNKESTDKNFQDAYEDAYEDARCLWRCLSITPQRS